MQSVLILLLAQILLVYIHTIRNVSYKHLHNYRIRVLNNFRRSSVGIEGLEGVLEGERI